MEHPGFNFTPFPILETERLLLRQLQPEDRDDIFKLRSDERVNKYLDRAKANSPEDATAFIERINTNITNNQAIMWAIVLKNSHSLAGTLVYWNLSEKDLRAEIGYELHPDFQGKGLMQEALPIIIRFGFETMGLKTIQAYTMEENTRSVRLLVKNNFTLANVPADEENAGSESGNTLIYKLERMPVDSSTSRNLND